MLCDEDYYFNTLYNNIRAFFFFSFFFYPRRYGEEYSWKERERGGLLCLVPFYKTSEACVRPVTT